MKKHKRLLLSTFFVAALFFLSGCVQTKNGVPTGEGWVYEYLVAPMGQLITFFAKDQGLGFGMGIILTTLIVRLLILPLGLYQVWKSSYQAVRREHLKPVLQPIQDAMNRAKEAGDQQEMMRLQQEMMAVQKENGISLLGGIGCLPLFLQMPFFTAIFYATRFTEGIAESTFLGMKLGEPSIILTIVVGLLYFAQSYLSMQALDSTQREQMKSMMYMSPIMIVVFSFFSPAAGALYWLVGGFVQIFQQLIINYLVRPRHRRKVAEEFEKNPPKPRPVAGVNYKRDVTPQSNNQQAIIPKKAKKRRNAGKQRSR